ncbi:hypothetical protein NKI74_23630 [Mesorhizobium sp. M0494]|uniref:hypothetical protein n=1 Tax=Mesorhizobium sp. M0494 TaxID=2956951 RepID=UPI00333D26E7
MDHPILDAPISPLRQRLIDARCLPSLFCVGLSIERVIFEVTGVRGHYLPNRYRVRERQGFVRQRRIDVHPSALSALIPALARPGP